MSSMKADLLSFIEVDCIRSGQQIVALCRKVEVSVTTFQRWKAKYGGFEVNETCCLKQLENENRPLSNSSRS